MKTKIGVEEHFAINETIQDPTYFLTESVWPELKSRLLIFSKSASVSWMSLGSI